VYPASAQKSEGAPGYVWCRALNAENQHLMGSIMLQMHAAMHMLSVRGCR
jgi:hypothetical protein